MIGMKIECIDEKITVYLHRYKLNVDNIEKLNKDIKNLFIKLIKVYKLPVLGYSKVYIYHNDKYGSILEIEKIYNNEYNMDIIDLKLIVFKDVLMYLEFDDFYFKDDNLLFKNNKYYLDISKIDNLYKYIEFGKIVCEKESY